eukprot:TRINITY_DN9451_c0_g1_i1.p1 TRINITY_DN9451_c0_g1~~TRINITY_DN9451_c0_g1_i1.p1  ORF type:complete len:770 (+),score=96.23 TRINITY_DN9451_c0_g1_i1:51-2360(+)
MRCWTCCLLLLGIWSCSARMLYRDLSHIGSSSHQVRLLGTEPSDAHTRGETELKSTIKLGTLVSMLMSAVAVLIVRRFFWRAQCNISPTAVLAVRVFFAFSLAMVSATLVEAAERCGLETWQAVACMDAFRMFLAALTCIIAVFADSGLGSHVPVEYGSFIVLEGAACYAIAVHRLDVHLLLVGSCCVAVGLGTIGAALLVLGASHYEPGSQDRVYFFHKFFALMAMGTILGNMTAVFFWDVGLWVAPMVATLLGCIALLLCWIPSAGSAPAPQDTSGDEKSWVEMSKLSVCFTVAALFIPYYMVQQQSWTSWYLQAKEMKRNLGSVTSISPSSMQMVFYITRTLFAILLMVGVPLLGRSLPSAKNRCGLALALSSSAVACSAFLQGRHVGLSLFWQLPQFVLLGVADAIFLPAQSDLFLALAPPRAKHFVSTLAVCSHLVACGFLLLVEPSLAVFGMAIYAGQGMRAYLGDMAVLSFLVTLVLVHLNPQQCKSVIVLGLPAAWKRDNAITLIQRHGIRVTELATDDVTQIVEQCSHDQCDAVLVLDAGLQERLCEARSALLEAKVPILVPPVECCALERKEQWYRWMQANGFGELLPQRREGEFPCVVKWGNTTSGSSVSVVSSEEELAAEFPADVVVQKYVYGNSEYCWHFVSLNGCVHWQACVEHRFPVDFKTTPFIKAPLRKDQPRWQTLPSHLGDADVLKLQRVLESASYTGAGCFDLKFDSADGKMYIMEMNARMGGSVVFAPQSLFPEFFDTYSRCIKSQRD